MSRHIAALDGLRGVAVAAVVLYHVRPGWVPGGYLGVDLFFVLSGYLITSLLLEEADQSKRIDLSAFFARRARRLLPAVLLVVTAVVVYAAVWESATEVEEVRRHGLATLGYVANWVFIIDGDSYFGSVSGPPLLRHVWSLAIEEQFYLVWPAIVFVVMRRGGKRSVGALAMGLVALSALWMGLRFDDLEPSRVYFGTDARIFEPLIGAAIATANSLRDAVPGWIARLSVPAAAVWLVAILVVDDDWSGFYLGGAVGLAMVAGVLVLVASGSVGSVGAVLAWRPLVGLGVVSYGLYLWHWPILVVARRQGFTGPVADVTVVLISVLVAVASFWLVERPIRSGARQIRPARTLGLAMSTIGVVAAATVALTVTTPDRAASTAEEVIADLAESSQAARAETQPDETQPDEWDSGGAEQGDATGTGSEDNTGSAALTDSGGEDSPLTVMLIGDSAAWSLGGGEISFSDDHGPYVSPFDSEEVILVNLARKGYRLVPGSITDVGVRARNYADLDDEMLWRSTAAEIHPDVTAIMLGLSDIQSRVIDGTVVPFGSAEFDARLRAAAEELLGDLSRSGQVVILTSPPLIGADMPEPAMAEFFVEHGSSRIDHLNLVLAAVAIDEPLVDVVAFGGWLCPGLSENGRQSDIGLQSGCRLTIEGEPARFDGLHFNTEGALMATQWLTGQFLEITARGGAT